MHLGFGLLAWALGTLGPKNNVLAFCMGPLGRLALHFLDMARLHGPFGTLGPLSYCLGTLAWSLWEPWTFRLFLGPLAWALGTLGPKYWIVSPLHGPAGPMAQKFGFGSLAWAPGTLGPYGNRAWDLGPKLC